MGFKRSLDDIAITNRGYKVFRPKKQSPYQQKMQSFCGVRKFLLLTHYLGPNDEKVYITLLEYVKGEQITIGHRNPKNTQEDIQNAIKSLERKAKCKLYYVLLISTDGEYL